MRQTLCLALMAMTAGPVLAEVKTKDITFQSGDERINGFLAEPEGKGPFPAIVVIQEWWGLSDWIKDNAKRLAAQGYVCLAPDLYRGKVTDDRAAAAQLLNGLPRDRALRDLKAAVDTLTDMANVNKKKIGSIGWCMGGGYSLELALADPRVHACAMCYGRVVTETAKLKPLDAAVLGIFGEQDKGIPAASVKEFTEALRKAGKKIEQIKLFPAGHGFMRPNSPTNKNPAYNENAAKQAWQLIDQFFAKELAKK